MRKLVRNLRLLSLEKRRLKEDLIDAYKYLKGGIKTEVATEHEEELLYLEGASCTERLRSLLPWRYSEPSWKLSCVTCFRVSGRGVSGSSPLVAGIKAKLWVGVHCSLQMYGDGEVSFLDEEMDCFPVFLNSGKLQTELLLHITYIKQVHYS